MDDSVLQKKLKKMTALPKQVMKEAFAFFVKTTPKRTGNARRSTKLRQEVIEANYNYAGKLDEGSSSKAPDGMTEPTKKEISKILSKQVKKIGK